MFKSIYLLIFTFCLCWCCINNSLAQKSAVKLGISHPFIIIPGVVAQFEHRISPQFSLQGGVGWLYLKKLAIMSDFQFRWYSAKKEWYQPEKKLKGFYVGGCYTLNYLIYDIYVRNEFEIPYYKGYRNTLMNGIGALVGNQFLLAKEKWLIDLSATVSVCHQVDLDKNTVYAFAPWIVISATFGRVFWQKKTIDNY